MGRHGGEGGYGCGEGQRMGRGGGEEREGVYTSARGAVEMVTMHTTTEVSSNSVDTLRHSMVTVV